MLSHDLVALEAGEAAMISQLQAEAGLAQQVLAMEFRPGQQILMIRKAWLACCICGLVQPR